MTLHIVLTFSPARLAGVLFTGCLKQTDNVVSRAACLVALSVTGCLSTVANASAQPTYTLVEIPGGAGGGASTIDPTGTYVAGSIALPASTADPAPVPVRAFRWSGGTANRPQILYVDGASWSDRSSAALDVNASGEAIGRNSKGPFRWTSAGEVQQLSPDTPGAFAYAINAAGQAAGSLHITPTSFGAAVWAPGSSAATFLPRHPHEFFYSRADAINNAGVVVGFSRLFPCPNPQQQPGEGTRDGTLNCSRATRWSNGLVTTFDPPAGSFDSFATGINEAGQIVGHGLGYVPSGTNSVIERLVAVLWTGGAPTPTVLAPLNPRDDMFAADINASGQVVGQRGGGNTLGFLWQNGVTYDLTGLLDASGARTKIINASGISDDGKIAATACIYPTADLSGNPLRCVAAVLVPAPPAPPVPAYTRYLAEGATGAFFDTQIALLNPGTANASVTLQYLPAGGAPVTQGVTVPARTRLTVNPKLVPGLANAEFSTVVQASQELVVDRTMSWDGTGYGSHSETAVRSPATTWYLAEGATIGGFDLFYLLQNPTETPTTVRVRYLRTVGPPLTKDYVLPARSRANIWVNVEEFPGLGKALAAAEFSAVLESQGGTPIIVERAMYRSNQGRAFNAGHESTGVSAPATSWFLAEGATGDYFDMFVLIANPTVTDAQVTVTYLTEGGATYSRNLVAPANARSGIWVDQETFPGLAGNPLANAAVSTTVRSTNGVPLVVERAMWWPGDGSTWHEAHNSAGATATGTKWAVAEGEVGGVRGHETYLLIANTSAFAGSATVTLLFEDGTSLAKTYALLPSSRTNVAVGPHFGATVTGRRFGAVIESTGSTPAQVVVERAMYSSAGGVGFAAGTNALATKLQ